jgi:hypothetical protein
MKWSDSKVSVYRGFGQVFTDTSRTGLNSPKKQGGGQETRQIEHVTGLDLATRTWNEIEAG